MTVETADVNGSMLSGTPKTYLTLSAVDEVAQPRDGGLTVPPEAVVRDERDPMSVQLLDERVDDWTEAELRAGWGDR